MSHFSTSSFFFFFNDTAPTEIYTLSLHDALPIWDQRDLVRDHQGREQQHEQRVAPGEPQPREREGEDRKSTRLNSSHPSISYAVFCLKKKKQTSNRRGILTHSHLTPDAQRPDAIT